MAIRGGFGRAAAPVARSERSIRRTARRLLRDLRIDSPVEIEALRAALQARRGRPLHLICHEFPDPSLVGLWMQTRDADLIYYERDLTQEHQRRSILHEFGHLIFDHFADSAAISTSMKRSVVPTLPEDVVVSAMCCSVYDSPEEIEAEVFASTIVGWDARITSIAARGAGTSLEQAFGPPVGWR